MKLFWVDAFTERVFSGNPAAVIPLETWLDETVLQQIASENGLSETAFFVRTGPQRFRLRWFTPTIEVDLCGHATLASAHVIFHELGELGSEIVFDSRSGPLVVRRSPGGKLELDFPARPAAPAAAPATLLTGLGRAPQEVLLSAQSWLCLYPDAQTVAQLRPDFLALRQANPGRVIVTAPGSDCDFVSRFFAPDAGILEDPVTGSAHCTLAPFWAQRLGKTTLTARQLSPRGGELWCGLAGERVRIAGSCVLYLRGDVLL